MRKIILGTLAGATLLGTAVIGAPAASATETCVDVTTTTNVATFTALQPKDTVGQFENVWKHDYTVTVDAVGNFTGIGEIKANGVGDVVWTETVTGTFTDAPDDGDAEIDHVTFLTAPVGGGSFFDVVNAPTNGTTVLVGSNWVPNIIEFQISQPVFGTTTSQSCTEDPVEVEYKPNHGEYVSGAAHAGVKGKELAAIAKDVTLVGPYKPTA